MSKKTVVSVLAAMALSAAIAGPAVAGPPTYSGLLTCKRASDGQMEDLNTLTNATRQDINYWKGFWVDNGYCAKGTVSTAGLTKD